MKKHLLGGVAKSTFGGAEAEAEFEARKNNKQSDLAALKTKEGEARETNEKARPEAERKVDEAEAKTLIRKKAAKEAVKTATRAPAGETAPTKETTAEAVAKR